MILVQEARQGSEDAFGQLVRSHSARIINLAYRLVGNRDDAEDLAQEAFLKLHRSLKTFRGESSVGTWLYRTTSRLAVDHLRREKLKRALFFNREQEDQDPLDACPSPDASPRQILLAKEVETRIQLSLRGLSPRQRVVFSLRHFEEMSLRDIADALGLEEGTVKAHLHRAVRTLRRELKERTE